MTANPTLKYLILRTGNTSSRSSSLQHELTSSSQDEYSHSSQATNSTSPGTQSTQSTTVLSTFTPYPLAGVHDDAADRRDVTTTSSMSSSSQRSSHDPYLVGATSASAVTSPHNLSSQPLLSDYEPCSGVSGSQQPRGLKHSMSHDQQLMTSHPSQQHAKQTSHHPQQAAGW